ncbi:hypothetical protein KI387_006197, partial [Taxus chinensis]
MVLALPRRRPHITRVKGWSPKRGPERMGVALALLLKSPSLGRSGVGPSAPPFGGSRVGYPSRGWGPSRAGGVAGVGMIWRAGFIIGRGGGDRV